MEEILKIEFKSKNENRINLYLKELTDKEIKLFLDLQNTVVKNIDDLQTYAESTDMEYLDSVKYDLVYGIYASENNDMQLVAACIIIKNRITTRNLAHLSQELNPESCVTIDTVFVAPEYRGYGIQKFFIEFAEKVAFENNANCMLATVSPSNKYSYNNLLMNGYSPLLKNISINEGTYGGSIRDLMIKRI